MFEARVTYGLSEVSLAAMNANECLLMFFPGLVAHSHSLVSENKC